MGNQMETIDQVNRFFKARVPVIVLRSQEPKRAIETIEQAAASLPQIPTFIYSAALGLQQLPTWQRVSDDRSINAAVEYATNTFNAGRTANFVFIDVADLDQESVYSKHFVEVARIAGDHEGAIVLITSKPVWSPLARLGMTTVLDVPTKDELIATLGQLVDMHRRPDFNIQWGYDDVRQAGEILQGVTRDEAINILATVLAKGSLLPDDLAELSRFKDQIFGDLAGLERIRLKPNDYQIGGLETLRQWLRTRERLMKADLSATTLHPPKGIMLCGVPGCGKSLSAKAIATEWRLPLYRLDMGAVMGMYVGESEARLREALETADRVAPCVLWIDEIEKGLASGMGDNSVTKRLIGQFLFWLQEHETRVFLVATANDVTSLPPELLRKGRFDEIFFVDLPTDEERAEIIRLYFLKHMQSDPSPSLLEDLVQESEGFAGSDIAAVCEDIRADMFLQGMAHLPDGDFIVAKFRNVMPFSKMNPEDVVRIRAWGRDRAIPAGRPGRQFDVAGGPHVRRVVSLN